MLAVAAAVFALDQTTKALVSAALAPGEHESLVLGVDLAHVRNRGIAFGLFADGQAAVLVVTVAALVLIGVYFAYGAARPGLWLGVGLLLGGAVGNLVDRLSADFVTDFIDPPLWPAFNVADIAIVVGIVVLVLAHRPRPESQPAAPG